MFASILELSKFTLRNSLFVVWQGLILICFMFVCGGVLFLIKWKW